MVLVCKQKPYFRFSCFENPKVNITILKAFFDNFFI